MNKLIVLLCMVGMFSMGQATTRRWVDTYVFSGTGTTQTAPMRFWDTKWRVVYKPAGSGPLEIHLLNLNTQEQLKVTNQKSGKLKNGQMGGSGAMEAASLVVNGGENGWRVTIQQYLDRVEEWQFTQQKPWNTRLKPLGSWSGEQGDHEFTFELPAKCARVRAVQLGEGYLRIDIIDPDGKNIIHSVSTTKGEHETWLYEAKTYTVKVSAVETSWNLHLETLDDVKNEEKQ